MVFMARADLRTLIVASMAGASMLGLKPVYGQDSTSREVRQALPSEEVEQLLKEKGLAMVKA